MIPMVAMLYSMFTKLLVVHAQMKRNENVNLSNFGVNSYFLKEYQEGARNYSLPQIVSNIHYLRLADLHCKGVDSNSDDAQELKELIARLLG
jgi:DNA polymerase-3 subunit delta